jgi:hypothetical protein
VSQKQPTQREFLYLCESLESMGYGLKSSLLRIRPGKTPAQTAIYSNGRLVVKLEVHQEDR